MSSDKRKWNKSEKDRKNMGKKKKNNSAESNFSENEIPDLNSMKPFKFEPKTNIGDIMMRMTVLNIKHGV